MPKHSSSALPIVLVLIALLGLATWYFLAHAGSLGTCTFPPNGGTCTHSLVLPENRSYVNLAFNLSFSQAPGTGHTTTLYAITNVSGRSGSTTSGEWRYAYLYALPASALQAYDVTATVTDTSPSGQGGCDPRRLTLYKVAYPQPTPTLYQCDSDMQNNCGATSLIDRGRQGYNDAIYTYLAPLVRLAETTTTTASTLVVTATIPPADLFVPTETNTFVVGTACNASTSRLVDPASVTVTIRPAEHPTNLALKLNNATLTTLSGPQTTSVRTADVAAAVNAACSRPTSAGACTIYLGWTSTTAGTLDATADATLQAMTAPTTNTTNTSNYTVTNMTICGTCTSQNNATCGTCGGSIGCAQDLQTCSDGTTRTRQLPDCTFPPCPSITNQTRCGACAMFGGDMPDMRNTTCGSCVNPPVVVPRRWYASTTTWIIALVLIGSLVLVALLAKKPKNRRR